MAIDTLALCDRPQTDSPAKPGLVFRPPKVSAKSSLSQHSSEKGVV
jgi:hypothetical protein